MKLRTVAVLCVSGRSIYKHLPGVDAYDQRRDARSFAGHCPVVAHPPCRCWSKHLAHQAKPADPAAEMALGLWCVEQVIEHGGVLEQPAGSRLFQAAGLPGPGDMADPFLYTVYVEQWWWGFVSRKATWLLVAGVPDCQLPPVPFRLGDGGNSQELSHFGRARTLEPFAAWLLATARATWWPRTA